MHFRFDAQAVLAGWLLLMAGCATQPIYVPLPPSHPASPWAAESPVTGRTNTLAINHSEKVPPNPDWQIPGMRDDEMHGHAAGSPSEMDMMGHGHMMMGHGNMDMPGSHGAANSSGMPGMVKMSAPSDKVDYVPDGAVHPNGKEPAEHQPEAHLDHMDPERSKPGFQVAPVAPPMDHSGHDMGAMKGMEGMKMDHSKMDHSKHEGHNMKGMDMDKMDMDMPGMKMPMDKTKPMDMKNMDMDMEMKIPMDHEAMGHMNHGGETTGSTQMKSGNDSKANMMDHSHHGKH